MSIADEVLARLTRIECKVDALAQMPPAKELYTTEEFAKLIDGSEYTIRKWCREGRIEARRAAGGRGRHKNWRISHSEYLRFGNDGPLPPGTFRNG